MQNQRAIDIFLKLVSDFGKEKNWRLSGPATFFWVVSDFEWRLTLKRTDRRARLPPFGVQPYVLKCLSGLRQLAL